MERRNFFKLSAFSAFLGMDTIKNEWNAKPRRPQKTVRLREGMTVGLIAPAGPVSEEKRQAALKNMETLGLKVKWGPNASAQNGYLAGADAQRLADLHWAFQDPEVEVVWCLRGGYGCTRLIPQIDFDLIRRNPKPFIGYSDITALHLAIGKKAGFVTYHGPGASSDMPEPALEWLRNLMIRPVERFEIFAPADGAIVESEAFQPFVITPGIAQGELTGGNLTLLSSAAGTSYAPSFKGKIAFIEDVEEQPYRVDRMLTQLLQTTDLAKATGIALGVFIGCSPKGSGPSLTLQEVLRDRIAPLGIPAMYGFPFGHMPVQTTLPCGIPARLDTEKRSLTLLEQAVL